MRPYATWPRRAHAPVLFSLLLALHLLPATATLAQDAPAGEAVRQTFLPVVAGAPGDDSVIEGQYIVLLTESAARAAGGGEVASASFAQSTVARFGGKVLYTYGAAVNGFAAVLPPEAVRALEADPAVARVEPDLIVTVDATDTAGAGAEEAADDGSEADATQSPAPWGLDRIDQRDLPLNNRYTYNLTGHGIDVYVIDTGILATHREFAGRMGSSYSAINDGRGATDCNGRGTHVAGIIGGTTYGVAKGATLHPVRVFNCKGAGSVSGVIAGLNWVVSDRPFGLPPGAVASLSMNAAKSQSFDMAVQAAADAGITVVVAAGNANADACNYSPSGASRAIAVGASTKSDARSPFSNFGPCVGFFAPGSGITSAWHTNDKARKTLNGSAMAAAHATGAAALYLELEPNAWFSDVAADLRDNATPDKITSAGAGSPNRLLYTSFIGATASR